MVESAETAAGRTRPTILAAFAVGVALLGVLVSQLLASSPSAAASPFDGRRSERPHATVGAALIPDRPTATPSSMATGTAVAPPVVHRDAPRAPGGVLPDGPTATRPERRGSLGEADGVIPDGTTVFDDDLPGVANLDSELLRALREAATDAAHDGVEFIVDSGWRSPEYQQRLLEQAISKYGSEREAARWVATPTTSAHVTGGAIDIGHADATAWLSRHGAQYGLCQIYRNEPWHYELRPEAIDGACPPKYADPTQDPRMQE